MDIMKEAVFVGEIPWLREIIIFLVASVVIVPVFHFLRVSPVLGFLLVGAVIGPFGVGLVEDVGRVHALADLGIVFLLFTIGLEVSFDRLRTMRRLVFGLGVAQVVVTSVIITMVLRALGIEAEQAIILGLALSLSSTAVVMQILIERNEFSAEVGRTSLSVLLLQDLSVVVLLALIDIFGQTSQGFSVVDIAEPVGKGVLVIVAIVTLGWAAMRLAYPFIARTGSAELFTALTLLAILGMAWVTGISGLSMSLGAFLAGFLLSETEFRHQVEVDIMPFRGLLLGLFFIFIGMSIDFTLLQGIWQEVALGVAGLIILKGFILWGLCLLFSISAITAMRVGLLLGGAGEFAFVAINASLGEGILDNSLAHYVLLLAALSLAVTPLLMLVGVALERWLGREEENLSDSNSLEGHVIIAGYGRVGRMVGRLLTEQQVPFLALDMDTPRVRFYRRTGEPVYYGNVIHSEVMVRMGIERAALVLITVDNDVAASRAVISIRQRWRWVPVYVRARDIEHSNELTRFGATVVVPETMETSLQLGGQVLRALGAPLEAVAVILERVRDENYVSISQKEK
ncbi:MAG: monovalent cation:proton antiporter-2 (CPA2) family protein [Parvularculales bacterium]